MRAAPVTPLEDARPAPFILDEKDPLPTARTFLVAHYMNDIGATLHRHRGAFYSWLGTHYVETSEAEIRAGLYDFLGRAFCIVDGQRKPFKPTISKVNDVLDALRAIAHLHDGLSPPAWLDGRAGPEPTDLIACRNALLHVPSGHLALHSPLFFGLNAVEFDYDADAPEPDEWIKFLWNIWPRDGEAIDCLQEMFGYLLTTDTRQQKMFLLVGPKRSGKGTIARVLKALLGSTNIAGPTLNSLGTQFGKQPLIGKQLAVISDARLSGRADAAAIAEALLTVSGEDGITIDRKHRESWYGTLPTRFLILTNELPRITDSSGALASRFIVLTLAESFYGREDHGLTARLLGELPGIMNWALEGLRRLQHRGHFRQPASSSEAIQDLEDLGSPISAFIRERCIIAAGKTVPCTKLFDAWKAWCEAQGRDHAGTVQTFGRDLRAAEPGLKIEQPREGEGGKQVRKYTGIGLQPTYGEQDSGDT
jgi:putative DNA primase/helicase